MGSFATLDPTTGRFNTWDRSAPIEATTLRDLTQDSYKGRTARILTENDFSDPRLAGYKYDPKYEWTGYLYSDLMKNAPGASLALAGDPRAAFFREQARQMVVARGEEPTAAAVEKQFQRNIADANTWALIDPDRKADEFALDDYRTRNDIRAHSANAATDYYYKHKDDQKQTDENGWNVAEDVYVTSLAKAAGKNNLPQNGVDASMLSDMLKEATKNQNKRIKQSKDVFSATGSFISTEKIGGLIQADGKNGRGYFLNSGYFKNLHDLEDIRSSYKGWLRTGSSVSESKKLRADKKQLSKDIVKGIKEWETGDGATYVNQGYRLKVVPEPDKNGNNTYSMVGDDGRWHTYARVRVYMSNGKNTTPAGTDVSTSDTEKSRHIPKEGRTMALEIGLHSNQNAATPDYSVSAMEDLGMYGYNYTTKEVGRNLNTGFAFSNNTVKR